MQICFQICVHFESLCVHFGQSAVKPGFNITDNLEDVTLTSLRSVLSCNSAGNRYKNDLEQRRKESANTENNQKRKQLSKELSVVKRNKVEMEDFVKELDADADKFVSEAGISDDMVEMKIIGYEGEFL